MRAGKIFPGEAPVGRDKVFPPKKAGGVLEARYRYTVRWRRRSPPCVWLGHGTLDLEIDLCSFCSLQVHVCIGKIGESCGDFCTLVDVFCRSSALRKRNRQVSGISEAASVLRYLAVLGAVSIFGISVVHYPFSGSVKSDSLSPRETIWVHSPWVSFCRWKSPREIKKKTVLDLEPRDLRSLWCALLLVYVGSQHGTALDWGAIWGWWVDGVKENCHGVFSFWNVSG